MSIARQSGELNLYILVRDQVIQVEGNLSESSLLWGRWMRFTELRRVRRTTSGSSWISTVFLGLDHRFIGVGPPIVFETMVFGGPLNEETDRYDSYKAAVRGHYRMVNTVRCHRERYYWSILAGRIKNQLARLKRLRVTIERRHKHGKKKYV